MELKALTKISYGMYVVCSRKEDKFNGQIANTVFQVTNDPPTIAVSINKENLTHEYILASKVFSLSTLSINTPLSFIGNFGFKSGRNFNKFTNVNYKIGITGAPIVTDYAVCYFELELINTIDVISHTIFIGKVIDAQILKDEEPLTYKSYQELKKGKTPKSAPTFILE